jgi:hypothetical protein
MRAAGGSGESELSMRVEIAPGDYGIDAVYVTTPLSAVVPP